MNSRSTTSQPPRALIIASSPHYQGGVLTMAQTAYDLMRQMGYECTLAFPGTLQEHHHERRMEHVVSRLQGLRTIQRGTIYGMQALAIPGFPGVNVNAWQNRWFAWRLKSQLPLYDVGIAVSATAHLALSLARWKQPFLCWIATVLRDELQSKVAGGDAWAAAQLAKRSWPAEEAQERLVLSQAQAVLVLSQHTADRVQELVPSARVRPLPMPIDLNLFHADDNVPRHEPPILIFAARYTDLRKNATLLLQAFARVVQQVDARLQLVGDQPTSALVALCESLGLTDRVEFIPYMPREALADRYRQATLFVMPSQQEGLGIVVLEAIACGLPVVSTRCGGPEAILSESEAGLLTDHTPEDFASAIIQLLSNDTLRQAMSRQGITYARTHFSLEVIGASFGAAIQEVFGDQT